MSDMNRLPSPPRVATACNHPGPKAPIAQQCEACFFAGATRHMIRSSQWCSRCKEAGHSAWYCKVAPR